MRCNVCGNELDDSMDFCPKCGTKKPVFAKRAEQSAPTGGETAQPKTAQAQRTRPSYDNDSATIDSIVVKNRKTSAIAGVDAKKITIIIVTVIAFAILITITLVDNVLKKKVAVGPYTLSVPASMKKIKDDFYNYSTPNSSIALSNNRMEIFCEEYDVYKLYPGALNAPDPSEFEKYAVYLEERDKAQAADLELLKDLDTNMQFDMQGYKKLDLTLNELSFTYQDADFGTNYVQMMTKQKDNHVYLFTILCSEDKSEGLKDDIRKILTSVQEK